ncbi:MAG: aminopeptidase P family protein [Actinobacteria bacterium]|nr:aminopeptidase P family protein [Actinomycetota bacterium]
MSRLERLAARLERPLLVTKGVHVRYLVGFASSNVALLVEPLGHTRLYTDFRYVEAARAVADVELVRTKRDVIGALSELLAGQSVAIEAEHVSVAAADRLRAGGAELVSTAGVVEGLRAIKEPAEIEAIRAACRIADAVYGDLAEERFTGRTEKDLAWFVERRFRERGADALAFPPIVASGTNGSRPHAVPQEVEIPAGTLVTVDMGGLVEGYNSDATRTFATGPLPDRLAEAYAICAAAQLDGLAAVRAGVTGAAADAAARSTIEAAGLGEAFGHGLGHGVGLEVHEAPTLRPESADTLAAGNVVSVEPGVYLEGLGGVRIEDLVAVTETGCDVLAGFTKELVTVR